MSRKSRSQSSSRPLACPTCARSYELSERFCPRCEMPLVYAGERANEQRTTARERALKVNPVYAQGEPVRVAFARHEAEADLVRSILLEEGIPSLARRTRGFDVPDFLAAGPRDILVPESGAELARALLRDVDVAETIAPPGRDDPDRRASRVIAFAVALGAAAALAAWLASRGVG